MNEQSQLQPASPSQGGPIGPSQPGVIAPWLLITFIIVLLGGGGYLGWYWYSQSKAKTATPVTSTTTLPAGQSPLGGATADWKTYENAEFNFSINYPTTFQLKEDKPSSKLFSSIDGHFWITIEDNTKKLDADGIKNDYYQNDDYGYQYQDSFVTVTGINSYKQGRYDLGVIEKYYIPKNDKIYNIAFEFNFDTPNQTLKDSQTNLISQILSTFQFTP